MKGKSLYSTALVLIGVLLIVVSATGCMAAVQGPPVDDIWSLSAPSTLAGVRAIVNGTTNFGIIMLNERANSLIVMWPMKGMNSWAAIFVNTSTLKFLSDKSAILQAIGQANIFNSATMGDFEIALKENGFVQITSAEIGNLIATAFKNAKVVPVLIVPGADQFDPENLSPEPIQQ